MREAIRVPNDLPTEATSIVWASRGWTLSFSESGWTLRLVREPPERAREHDPVDVLLERAVPGLRFRALALAVQPRGA
jgi:hypothetical protein